MISTLYQKVIDNWQYNKDQGYNCTCYDSKCLGMLRDKLNFCLCDYRPRAFYWAYQEAQDDLENDQYDE